MGGTYETSGALVDSLYKYQAARAPPRNVQAQITCICDKQSNHQLSCISRYFIGVQNGQFKQYTCTVATIDMHEGGSCLMWFEIHKMVMIIKLGLIFYIIVNVSQIRFSVLEGTMNKT